jgi:hypothetical protein
MVEQGVANRFPILPLSDARRRNRGLWVAKDGSGKHVNPGDEYDVSVVSRGDHLTGHHISTEDNHGDDVSPESGSDDHDITAASDDSIATSGHYHRLLHRP